MITFRILGTVFMGISCLTSVAKTMAILKDSNKIIEGTLLWTLYSWAWRAFVIVALWVI